MKEELNDLVAEWKNSLHKHVFLEEGMIKELENHLLNSQTFELAVLKDTYSRNTAWCSNRLYRIKPLAK